MSTDPLAVAGWWELCDTAALVRGSRKTHGSPPLTGAGSVGFRRDVILFNNVHRADSTNGNHRVVD